MPKCLLYVLRRQWTSVDAIIFRYVGTIIWYVLGKHVDGCHMVNHISPNVYNVPCHEIQGPKAW